MRSIHITEARNLLTDVARLKPAAVLSIEHPGALTAENGRAPRLIDHCIDIPQQIQTYYDTESVHRKGPSKLWVGKGITFLRRYRDKKGPLIVHCRQGKARSVAMALVYLVDANPEETIEACIAHLKTLRPGPEFVAPNLQVIALADAYLGKNGALVAAVLADPEITIARARANAARAAWVESHPQPLILRRRPPSGPYSRSKPTMV